MQNSQSITYTQQYNIFSDILIQYTITTIHQINQCKSIYIILISTLRILGKTITIILYINNNKRNIGTYTSTQQSLANHQVRHVLLFNCTRVPYII